ncbi:recombinase RecT [Curtobacterium poinsettiae]|uniref:recombinase RecT n=1 Tax=Curtobacterium poinsettiae TaxID=159612 RepID=UPI00217E40DD|nr:recombinase RecT [Curtobacterium flaccumfaciens]MCS6578231.1 recombinase RecT [Curtobacterium flaccumfaciens]
MSDLVTAAAEKQVQRGNPTMRDLVQAQQSAIEVQLAGTINSGAFVRAAISEISKTPKLQEATPQSVLGSIMLAAQLKLEIGSALGQFYLTPRKDGGQQICLPIIGYQGFIELAYRSGRIDAIETLLIREGDAFNYWADSTGGLQFDWKPVDHDESRPWVGAIGVAHIKGGGRPVWAYLPREKVLARRPRYWESGPWKTNEEEMARKTIVRAMAPYLPKSTEFARAVEVTREVEENGKRVDSIQGLQDLVIQEPTPDPQQ